MRSSENGRATAPDREAIVPDSEISRDSMTSDSGSTFAWDQIRTFDASPLRAPTGTTSSRLKLASADQFSAFFQPA